MNPEVRYMFMEYFIETEYSGYGCHAHDFLSDTNKVVLADEADKDFFRMTCFQNAALVKAKKEIYEWSRDFVSRFIGFRCIDVYQSAILHRELLKHNWTMSGGEGFLPDMDIRRKPIKIGYPIRPYDQNDMKILCEQVVDTEWHMSRPSEDTSLAFAAFDNGRVIGLSTADGDTDKLWSIDAEVLPGYRKKGIAVALTTEMTNALLRQGRIPFATAAWSNVASKTVLFRCGYYSAWSGIESCEIGKYL